MLNPILNKTATWKWIDTMLSGAVCMTLLYDADYPKNKKDLAVAKQICLNSAIIAFKCLELSKDETEMVKQIDIERDKSYECAILAASDLTSPFAAWNATRANIHRHNADILLSEFNQKFKEKYGLQ